MAEISAIYDTAQYDNSEYDTILYSSTIPGLAFISTFNVYSRTIIGQAFLFTKTLGDKPRVHVKLTRPMIFTNEDQMKPFGFVDSRGKPFVFGEKNYKR